MLTKISNEIFCYPNSAFFSFLVLNKNISINRQLTQDVSQSNTQTVKRIELNPRASTYHIFVFRFTLFTFVHAVVSMMLSTLKSKFVRTRNYFKNN